MSCNVMGHNVNMLTRVMTGVSQDLQLNLKKKKKLFCVGGKLFPCENLLGSKLDSD